MSRGATLSIMGLYNNDPTVFDMMVFPDGFTDAQKTTTKENILVECAELEFLYPAPEVAKTIIGIWSRKELPYWNRVYSASQAEYNPIENYRRNETETVEDGRTEEHSGNDVSRASGTDTNARTGTETTDHDAEHVTTLDETNVDTLSGDDQLKRTGTVSNSGSSSSTDTNSGTDTVNNKVTGYDSDTLVPHDSSDTVHGHVVTNAAQGTNTTTHNTTDKTEYGKVDTTDHDAETTETHDDTDILTLNTLETFVHGKTDTLTHGEKIEHEGTTERTMLAYGNIGVTTSQEMLTQELELAKIIEVIPIIIDSFKNRFCLMVY